ncbi:unnamed protein product [Ascophyllum nodosum]
MKYSSMLEALIDDWPNVPVGITWGLVAIPIVTLVACCLWLRIFWPGPIRHNGEISSKQLKDYCTRTPLDTLGPQIEATDRSGRPDNFTVTPHEDNQGATGATGGAPDGPEYAPTTPRGVPPGGSRLLEAGEVAGDYSANWMTRYVVHCDTHACLPPSGTFGMTLVVVTVVWLMVNAGLTVVTKASLVQNQEFWILQIPKVALMNLVSMGAGFVCRRFCPTDDQGCIITAKSSWFEVNYTRKIQHFAANLVPLLFSASQNCNCHGTLELSWSVWVTLVGFTGMIKPIREAFPLVMLQFNGLDRPEDRPNTPEWIVLYNIWPGEVLIALFAHLFAVSGQGDLVFILILVTGIGDGLAEPVGIWLGHHKYKVGSFRSNRLYERSFEGSCTVFVVTVATIVMVYADFETFWEFLAALLLLPIALTLAEAFSPHTMDTPFIMGVGGVILYGIIFVL